MPFEYPREINQQSCCFVLLKELMKLTFPTRGRVATLRSQSNTTISIIPVGTVHCVVEFDFLIVLSWNNLTLFQCQWFQHRPCLNLVVCKMSLLCLSPLGLSVGFQILCVFTQSEPTVHFKLGGMSDKILVFFPHLRLKIKGSGWDEVQYKHLWRQELMMTRHSCQALIYS